MSLRRLNRTIKTRAQKSRPGAINRHVLVTERVGNFEHYLHATKGWRVRRA